MSTFLFTACHSALLGRNRRPWALPALAEVSRIPPMKMFCRIGTKKKIGKSTMKTIINMLWVLVLAFPMLSQADCSMDGAGNATFSGEYVCSVFCPAGGEGNTAQVYQNGASLTFVNEGGMGASGTLSGGVAQVSEWGVTATFGSYCESIAFSNSTIWSLLSAYSKSTGEEDCEAAESPIVGNPVNVGIGNKFQAENDYSSAGGLSFRRLYQSDSHAKSASLGKHWIHDYDRKITSHFYNANGFAFINRPNGKGYSYQLINGVWVTDADTTDILVELKDASGNLAGWRYTVADDHSVEIYNAIGNLTSISSRSGLTQMLGYDASNRLISITDAFGRNLSLGYDSSNRIASMTDPAEGVYAYGYDGNNNLITVTYPDTHTRTYLYENASFRYALTGIVDENGDRYATFGYDSTGRAISTEHAGSVEKYSIAYTVNSSGRPTTSVVTDPLGTIRTYNLTKVLGVVKSSGQNQPAGSGCAAASAAATYDANGNIATRTDFNGNMTTYVYDLSRNLETSRTEGLTSSGAATPATRTITTAWDPVWRLPITVTEYGGATATGTASRQSTTSYDSHGNITQIEESDPAHSISRATTITYTYSGTVDGLVLAKVIDGPRTDVSDVTTITYYPESDTCLGCRGQVKTITNALGQLTQYTSYNVHGQLLNSIDPNGVVTTYTYDARQRLTSRTIGSETTGFTFDAAGQVTKLTLPDNSSLNYSYDAAHRLTDIQDALGNKIHYTLDAMGNRIKEDTSDPQAALAKTLSRSYDALNRLQQVTGVQ